MVSAMGDPSGKGSGNFILFDQDLKVGFWQDCYLVQMSICPAWGLWHPGHKFQAMTFWLLTLVFAFCVQLGKVHLSLQSWSYGSCGYVWLWCTVGEGHLGKGVNTVWV